MDAFYNRVPPHRKPLVSASGFDGSLSFYRGAKRHNQDLESIATRDVNFKGQPRQVKELLSQQGLAKSLQGMTRPAMDFLHKSSADQHVLKAFHVSSNREAKVQIHPGQAAGVIA